MKKIKKAIFPIAGLGTRFLPATKSIPKEMLTILDRPIIEWAVLEANKSGIEQMIFVISPNKKSIIEHFKKSKILENVLKKKKKLESLELITSQSNLGKISVVYQREPKGLGHAVWCARKLFNKNEMFAVILPDDIILSKIPVTKQLITIFNKTGGSVIGLEKVRKNEVFKYGIIEKGKDSGEYCSIKNIVEKPDIKTAPSNLSVIGRYILHSDVFKYLSLKKLGFGGEIQLTDALNTLKVPHGLLGLEFKGERFDCGSKLGFIKANLKFGLNDSVVNKQLRKILKEL